jgi:hypothetical protein
MSKGLKDQACTANCFNSFPYFDNLSNPTWKRVTKLVGETDAGIDEGQYECLL